MWLGHLYDLPSDISVLQMDHETRITTKYQSMQSDKPVLPGELRKVNNKLRSNSAIILITT